MKCMHSFGTFKQITSTYCRYEVNFNFYRHNLFNGVKLSFLQIAGSKKYLTSAIVLNSLMGVLLSGDDGSMLQGESPLGIVDPLGRMAPT